MLYSLCVQVNTPYVRLLYDTAPLEDQAKQTRLRTNPADGIDRGKVVSQARSSAGAFIDARPYLGSVRRKASNELVTVLLNRVLNNSTSCTLVNEGS